MLLVEDPKTLSFFYEKQVIVKEIMHGIIKGLWILLIPDVVFVMVNMKLNSK